MRELLVLLLFVPFGLLAVLNDSLATYQPKPVSTPVVQLTVPAPAVSGSLVDAARSWLNTPYLWGGCTKKGVDCSCFVRNVLQVIGINAPRTTTEQIQWATPISRGEARLGDLVFFDNTCKNCGGNPTHVGLIIGENLMIHAGDPVQFAAPFTGEFASHNPRVGRPR